MSSELKKNILSKCKGLCEKSDWVFLLKNTQSKANDLSAMRIAISKMEDTVAFKAKNTLVKIAFKDSGFSHITDSILNDVLVIYTKDPIEVSKMIKKLVKSGSFECVSFCDRNSVYTGDNVKKFASIPPKEELYFSICLSLLSAGGAVSSAINSPASCLHAQFSCFKDKK